MANEFLKALDNLDFVQHIRENNTAEVLNRTPITEERFEKAFPKEDFLHIQEFQFNAFIKDLQDELNLIKDAEERNTLIEKAQKDLSKLVKVTKTDKKGKKITVYVKANQAEPQKQPKGGQVEEGGSKQAPQKEFNVNGMFLSAISSGKMTKESLQEAEKHYSELSHINKIRFEREWKKTMGEDYDQQTKYGEETKENPMVGGAFFLPAKRNYNNWLRGTGNDFCYKNPTYIIRRFWV